MKKSNLLSVLVLGLVVSGCTQVMPSTSQDQPTSAGSDTTAISIACNTPEGACSAGSTCYTSQTCPRGQACGPETGDLLCHKNCTANSDCSAETPTCTQIELWHGDVGSMAKICL